jgi:hypothetical protein
VKTLPKTLSPAYPERPSRISAAGQGSGTARGASDEDAKESSKQREKREVS